EPSRDSFELAELLERVDAHVRVRADADPDAALADAVDRREAVAEVRLCCRAHTDARACVADQVELSVRRVRRVDDGRLWAKAVVAGEVFDRSVAVLRNAIFDLARLLRCMHVQYEPLALGVASDFLEPV